MPGPGDEFFEAGHAHPSGFLDVPGKAVAKSLTPLWSLAMRTLLFGFVLGTLTGCAGTPSDSSDPELAGSMAEELSTSRSTGVAWVRNDRPGVGAPYFPPAPNAFNSSGASITIESEA